VTLPDPRGRASAPSGVGRRACFPFLVVAAMLGPLAVACGYPLSADELALTPSPSSSDTGTFGQPAVPLAAAAATVERGPSPVTAETGIAPAAATATATLVPISRAQPTATASPRPPAATSTAPSSTPTPPPPSATAVASAGGPGPAGGAQAQQAIEIINRIRAQANLSQLAVSPVLMQAAQDYARLLGERNWWGHDGPDGSSPQARIARAGYSGYMKGEALSAGQNNAQAAVDAWMGSPAHRLIIYEPAAVEIGMGYFETSGASYCCYWVLVTGVP
jgi:uncharacterized protein YkwD